MVVRPRRAALLAAALVVALATFAYALHEARPAANGAAAAPLEADGERAADPGAPCATLEVEAAGSLAVALAVGCGTTGPPAAPDPGPGGAEDGQDDDASPTPPPPTHGRGDEPPAATPTPPSTPSTPPPSPPAGDRIWTPRPDTSHAPPPGPRRTWPEGAYDALAPLLSPRAPPDPPLTPDEGSHPPADRCERVCDPDELGGTGRQGRPVVGAVPADGDAAAGLLARALEAADAYIRLRT